MRCQVSSLQLFNGVIDDCATLRLVSHILKKRKQFIGIITINCIEGGLQTLEYSESLQVFQNYPNTLDQITLHFLPFFLHKSTLLQVCYITSLLYYKVHLHCGA